MIFNTVKKTLLLTFVTFSTKAEINTLDEINYNAKNQQLQQIMQIMKITISHKSTIDTNNENHQVG
jgi:hypothetical protein